ncbi:winged helix-turn-helix domain-containing protein [Thermoanaerobacter thermohydrosulfuricus]|uniref:Putative transcriptional regulator n=1 Tax=Thermoanaerobacter thermohydrosulfuricus WC1 TaxID=1198630 RepID=M8DTI1_THETY|nr:winged helix-turn-helix domain-containing protein [Thermoanaerobacter thermohydrosulfuricus]EMT39771.1 putative transcriptional regulator [Thermoanaerobacter thermohydrosulfuricus WC1]SFE15332.1 transcriptional regulator, ArsR family [Thermoanaerobacter thermohydrosulfuricus]HHW58340.1 winged helix-turn-helix transcriptional regulator [Clostridia bacterium]
MSEYNKHPSESYDSNKIVKIFDALSHPVRIKILGILYENRQYISELARKIGISRPLLYIHLRKLEEAELVKASMEISSDGKATKYYELIHFDLRLTPQLLHEISKDINLEEEKSQ